MNWVAKSLIESVLASLPGTEGTIYFLQRRLTTSVPDSLSLDRPLTPVHGWKQQGCGLRNQVILELVTRWVATVPVIFHLESSNALWRTSQRRRAKTVRRLPSDRICWFRTSRGAGRAAGSNEDGIPRPVRLAMHRLASSDVRPDLQHIVATDVAQGHAQGYAHRIPSSAEARWVDEPSNVASQSLHGTRGSTNELRKVFRSGMARACAESESPVSRMREFKYLALLEKLNFEIFHTNSVTFPEDRDASAGCRSSRLAGLASRFREPSWTSWQSVIATSSHGSGSRLR
jgi:hypothetical protein